MLVDGTNEYAGDVIAEKERGGKLTPKSRWVKWRLVTTEEMKAVLAVIINMGVMHCPERASYWKTSWESYIPFFHDVLPRNRFEEIFWMLHLQEDTTSTRLRRIDKVKPLLDQLLTTFQSVFYPGREISVDETMVGFKGRVGFRQYCPLKPIKWGLKSFVLADSATGFILNIIPYTGGETKDIYLSNCNPELPSLTQIVLALVENYLHKGHHIYADRLYSSVPLVDELERCNTGYTGTLVRTRQQLPSVVSGKSFKLNKGETKAWRDGKKLVLAWRDKGKPTVMISTVYQGSMTTVRGRRGETREKPLVVDKYNQSMGGVDIADQYGCYYSFGRRSIKWWRKLMFWLLEVSLVNSYILYKATSSNHLSHSDYRRKLVVGLCEGLPVGDVRRQLMRPTRLEERFEGRHYIERGQSRRRCIVCNNAKRGQRHDTIFYCKTCTHNPPLHPNICFERYHELVNYHLAT